MTSLSKKLTCPRPCKTGTLFTHIVQKTTKACTVLTNAAGLRPFSTTVATNLIFSHIPNVNEVLSREDGVFIELKSPDAFEALSFLVIENGSW